jgi:CBS domain containing-hemolysin-like protein
MWLLLVASVALMAVCGIFVAAEFSFVTVSRPAIDQAADAGVPGARGVQAAVRTLSTQLSSAQIGITATNLAIGWLAEPSVAALIRAPLESAGTPAGAVGGIALGLALVLVTLATMVLGELVPKNLAIAHPYAVSRVVQAPQRAFTLTTRPLTNLLNGIANRIVRLLGIEPQEELASARTPEELVSVVRASAESGKLPEATADLLERMLRFDDKQARDVLTPRTRLVWVEATDPVQRVIDLAREHGVSRFPVAGTDLDDVVGVIELSQAVGVPREERPSTPVGPLAKPPLRLPHTAPLDEVLWALREARTELAVILDEYGGTAGIATFEDVVEEIVGEVSDEHDQPEPSYRRSGESWVVSGLLRPDELRGRTGLRLPEAHDRYDTIAGLVLNELGHVPAVGDSVVVNGFTLVVERMDGHRIDEVRIVPRERLTTGRADT